jgi:hypothetical protein
MKTVNILKVLILSVAGTALALAATGGLVSGQTTQPHEEHNAPAGSSFVEETAKARLATAERACKILHDLDTGQPLGHQGVEHTYVWSKRRMEAQLDVERLKPSGGDGGIAAIERHVQWMREWSKQVTEAQTKGAFSKFDVASTDYYVAEAEDLLAHAKAK